MSPARLASFALLSVPSIRIVVECEIKQAALRVERRLRVRVEPLVRIRDAAREREPARDRPDDDQHEEDQRCRARSAGPSAACPRRGGRPVRGTRSALHRRLRRRGGRPRRSAGVPSAASSGPCPWRDRPGRRDTASRPAPFGGVGYPAGMNANRVIGVDLGGTKILAGVIEDGRVLADRRASDSDDVAGRAVRRSRGGGSRAAARRCRRRRIRDPVARSTTARDTRSARSTSRCARSTSSPR